MAIFVLILKLHRSAKDATQNMAQFDLLAAAQQKQDLEAFQQPADAAANGLPTLDDVHTPKRLIFDFNVVRQYYKQLL